MCKQFKSSFVSPSLPFDSVAVANFFKNIDNIKRICSSTKKPVETWDDVGVTDDEFEIIRNSLYLFIEILEDVKTYGPLLIDSFMPCDEDAKKQAGKTSIDYYLLMLGLFNMANSVLPELESILDKFQHLESKIYDASYAKKNTREKCEQVCPIIRCRIPLTE